MKKVTNIIFILCLAFVMLIGLAGCGNKETQKNNDDTAKQEENSEIKWSSNKYTKDLPIPENATISDITINKTESSIEHTVNVTNWSIEDCKQYVEKIKSKGFTSPWIGKDDTLVIDNEQIYSFSAKNNEEKSINITIFSESKSGTISVIVLK